MVIEYGRNCDMLLTQWPFTRNIHVCIQKWYAIASQPINWRAHCFVTYTLPIFGLWSAFYALVKTKLHKRTRELNFEPVLIFRIHSEYSFNTVANEIWLNQCVVWAGWCCKLHTFQMKWKKDTPKPIIDYEMFISSNCISQSLSILEFVTSPHSTRL